MPDLTLKLPFDHFLRYDELTALLRAWADEHPRLLELESIGSSHEGRDIWLATVTNLDTGPAAEKPALLVDGNIHAVEVTGSTAALHLIDRLLRGHGSDARLTRALDTRAFYVIPRLNPDGAELALSDTPKFIRSSVRPYPRLDPEDGLQEEDVDGDRRILTMRLRDPNGAWKVHPEEPRLMIRRDLDDGPEDGEFYRLLPEGTITNWDGVSIKVAPPLEGLDLNRNFPGDWAPEGTQRGAGPYPTSEPEARALAQTVVDRPNICGHVEYHTFSGVHLRPYAGKPDEDLPTSDLRVYELFGEKGTELTGYPSVSIFHGFKYDPKQITTGSTIEWLYEHLGVFAWATEFWSPQREAGIEEFGFIDWIREHSPEDDLKLLRWNDDVLEGRGYADWTPFEHPQLGAVEIGGWDVMFAWANVPTHLLEREVAPHADWAVFLALCSPKLELQSFEIEALGQNTYLVRAILWNTGWLPTNVSEKALERKAVRPLEAELELPEGARLVGGEARVEAGQLGGRVAHRGTFWFGADGSTDDRTKVEWVVEAPAGGEVRLEARHERAGTVRASAPLSG